MGGWYFCAFAVSTYDGAEISTHKGHKSDALALLSQDPVVVAALDVAVLLDFREVRVRHAQLLTLIMVPATAVTQRSY